MSETQEETSREEVLERLGAALDEEDSHGVRSVLGEMHPAEIASALESLPHDDRDIVWQLIDPDAHSEVVAEAEDSVRAAYMRTMAPEALAAIAQVVDDDDAVDILQDLPEPVIEEVLQAMDSQERERLRSILVYPEDTAGGLMNLDVVTVRPDVTLEVVIRYLRRRGEIPEKTNRLYVVDRDGAYLAEMRLADLLINPPERTVADIMDDDAPSIEADTPEREVARIFEQRNLISAPVVDDAGRLVGRITIDDVVDVIRDEGEQSLMRMAGLDEDDDMFAPVSVACRRRAVWLGVNLVTAFLAAWVIGLFEATIQEIVALAVLMPVVASMGGIAGSQTLTVVIRAMALDQIGAHNAFALLRHELLVGALNGAGWSLVVALVAGLWFDSPGLGVIIGVAMLLNLLGAAVAGAGIPLLLRRLDVDPALAGGVILTTVTDVVGFMAFLGLGTVFLLH